MLTQRPARRSSRVRTVVVTAVVASVIVGAGAWVIGTMQGSDSARATAAEQIRALQEQLATVASPMPVPTEQVSPAPETTPTATPSPSVPVGPTPGQQVTVTAMVQVRPGDSWWLLAQRYLGSGSRYPELIAANPKVASLEPGISVAIPVSGTLSDEQVAQ